MSPGPRLRSQGRRQRVDRDYLASACTRGCSVYPAPAALPARGGAIGANTICLVSEEREAILGPARGGSPTNAPEAGRTSRIMRDRMA